MSLTSYQAAPPRDPRTANIRCSRVAASRFRKNFPEKFRKNVPPLPLTFQTRSPMKRLKRIQISFHEEPSWTVPVQKGQPRLSLHKVPLRVRSPDFVRLSRFRPAA